MQTLLWIIFIFILMGYAFKFFLKYGLPWLLGRFIRNQQEKYTGFANHNNPGEAQRKQGEVKIKTKSNGKDQHTKNDDDFGEYVEYEDIE